MSYTVNQYGVIKLGDQIIPMDENSVLYSEYINFLQSGGTVTDVIDEEIPIQTQDFVFGEEPRITRLLTRDNAIRVHDKAIEDILEQIELLKRQLEALQK